MSENKPAQPPLLRNQEPLNNNSSSEGVSVLAEVGQPSHWLYAVRRGRCPGVHDNIQEAEQQMAGYPGAQCCLFRSREPASHWVSGVCDEPPSKRARLRNEAPRNNTFSTPRGWDGKHYFTTPLLPTLSFICSATGGGGILQPPMTCSNQSITEGAGAPAHNSEHLRQCRLMHDLMLLVKEVDRMAATLNGHWQRQWARQRMPTPKQRRVPANLLTKAKAWANCMWLRTKMPGDVVGKMLGDAVREACQACAWLRAQSKLKGGLLAGDYQYFQAVAHMQAPARAVPHWQCPCWRLEAARRAANMTNEVCCPWKTPHPPPPPGVGLVRTINPIEAAHVHCDSATL